MGADVFYDCVKAATAEEAFRLARLEAQHDYGHAGYTGTIAEKSSFVMIAAPEAGDKKKLMAYACKLIDEEDSRVDNKWGPAGCIRLSEDEWLFFGWASS